MEEYGSTLKGFNRFYHVPSQKTAKERHAILKEVFDDMVPSGGVREGLVMPISSIFMSVSQAYNQNFSMVNSHGDFVEAGMIKALVGVGNKCLDDKKYRKFDQNDFCPYYCLHILSSLASDDDLEQRTVNEGAYALFVRYFKGGLTWAEARTAARGLSALAAKSHLHLFTPDVVQQAIEYFVTAWTAPYTHFIQKPANRKNPLCDMMTRGEGGTDEETYLAFAWMENLRSWSGMIVHLYFLKHPLEGTKIFIANPHLFDMMPMSFYYENQYGEDEEDFGSIATWGGMILESMASTALGRATILNNAAVVRVIQETARGPLHNFDRLLKVILACLSNDDSRARAFELFGDIICDVRYVWFEDNDGKITHLGEIIMEKVLEPYFAVPKYQPKNDQEKECIDEFVQNLAKNQLAQSKEGKKRIEQAKKLKDEGNKNISKNVLEASKCYQEAIHLCPESQKDLVVALYSNIAEAYSRLKQTMTDAKQKEDCNWKIIRWSTRAQGLEPRHPKTLWKRAAALFELGLYRAAMDDLNDFANTTTSLTADMEQMIGDCGALLHPYFYLKAKFGPMEKDPDQHDGEDSDDEDGLPYNFSINHNVNKARKTARETLLTMLHYTDHRLSPQHAKNARMIGEGKE